jgi:hypothetical protein
VEKFFALAILFCGAARIEERFLASPACAGRLAMATAHATRANTGKIR